ncbi:hypothetical protein CHS0354_029053 [Potamilus streckersoni]|uniref:Ubiquitin carboxyl-terminal hydrolase n=1 Tax=Potamilus streckersoni TaxID=2493646 RepID=A0AAE0SRW1_9BIVA|nr:hypothetical protein CHS0354_029053 [Potamilus streckersoni]
MVVIIYLLSKLLRMASQQEFSFIDLDQLTPEECDRILRILHGRQDGLERKVEFPWDDEDESISFGEQSERPVYDATQLEQQMEPLLQQQHQQQPYIMPDHIPMGFHVGVPYHGVPKIPPGYHFSVPIPMVQVQHHLPYPEGSVIEKQFNVSAGDFDGSAESKSRLEASLKTYERRNKKRRPPDYYNKVSDYGVTMYNSDQTPEDADEAHVVYRTELNSNVSSQAVGGFNPNMDKNIADRSNCISRTEIGHEDFESSGTTFMYSTDKKSVNRTTQYSTDSSDRTDKPMEVLQHLNVTPTPKPVLVSGLQTEIALTDSKERICSVQKIPNAPVDAAKPIPSTHTPYLDRPSLHVATNQSTANTVNNIFAPPSVEETIISSQVSSVENEPTGNDFTHTFTNNSVFNNAEHTCNDSLKLVTSCSPTVSAATSSDISSGDLVHVTDNTCSDIRISDVSQGLTTHVPSISIVTGPVVQEPPKTKTWAGLFKGYESSYLSAHPSYSAYSGGEKSTSIPTSVNNHGNNGDKKNSSWSHPQPVPASEDSVAKQLGDLLSNLKLSHTSIALQPRGLINRGNWCYINATLQALLACPPFYNMIKKLPKFSGSSRGPSSTPILDSIVEFVNQFSQMSKPTDKGLKKQKYQDIVPGPPFEPVYVYKMLQVIANNPHFKYGKQEDAEEFLSCILDGMNEEMSATIKLVSAGIDSQDGSDAKDQSYTNGYVHDDMDGKDEEEEVNEEEDETWEQVGPKKKSVFTRRANFAKSPIADIFGGLLRSAIFKISSKETATLEPFLTLQLDIQADKVATVKDALDGLVSHEVVHGYNCPKTKEEVEVVKKLSLEELPPVLILHLKCFLYNKDGCQKLMKKVEYGIDLEITKDLLSSQAKGKMAITQRSYKLFAVVYHHGKTVTGGHYTTSVFHPALNGWVNLDDSTVRTVPVAQVLKYVPQRVPYLLYYRRVDMH